MAFSMLDKRKNRVVKYMRIFLGILLTILFVLWEINDYKKNDIELKYAVSNNIEHTMVIGEVTKEVEVKQEFVATGHFAGVRLLVANYGCEKSGRLCVTIREKNNSEVVFSKEYDLSTVKDNSHFDVVMDHYEDLGNSKKHYEIIISAPDSYAGNAITIYASDKDMYASGDLYINNEIQEGDIAFSNLLVNDKADMHKRFINRFMIMLLVYIIVLLHLIIELKTLYKFVFRYRYLVALFVFVFMVSNKFHMSSVGMFDEYVQQGMGDETIVPLFGDPRAIRSDEWMVSTPRSLSSFEGGTGEYTDIPMALEMTNISATGLFLDYSALANPSLWGYYFLDIERAVSFQWNFNIIVTFFASFEMCMIISKRKKLVALFGACMITFSAYFMWWSTINWIMTGQVALVCAYYFIHANKKWFRLLCGLGIGIFFSGFVISLYPAWQVPAGFLYASILVWMLYTYRKRLMKFDKRDWMILAGVAIFAISVIGMYLYRSKEYITAITNTVYPGSRVIYGGSAYEKLFNFVSSVFLPYRDSINTSENAVMLSFFPIPLILGIYYLIKQKKKDKLIYILVCLSLIFSAYCFTELPRTLCKILLFTFSMPKRMVDIVGFLQVYLMVAIVGRIRKKDTISWFFAGGLSLTIAYFSARHVFRTGMVSAEYSELMFVGLILSILFTLIISKINIKLKNVALYAMIVICIVTGFSVHPIMKGLGVIYSKPVAEKVRSIVEYDGDAKWIVLGDVIKPNYLIACGARTINSTNYIPNMEMWDKLKLDSEYEEVYNRYAHLSVEFTDESTSVELLVTDSILLKLNYSQISTIGIDYILSGYELENTEEVSFDEIYDEGGLYIYRVNLN